MDDIFSQNRLLSTMSPAPGGVARREGMQFVAAFESPIDQLKIRNGRLTAKVSGMWHIIPDPKPLP